MKIFNHHHIILTLNADKNNFDKSGNFFGLILIDTLLETIKKIEYSYKLRIIYMQVGLLGSRLVRKFLYWRNFIMG